MYDDLREGTQSADSINCDLSADDICMLWARCKIPVQYYEHFHQPNITDVTDKNLF